MRAEDDLVATIESLRSGSSAAILDIAERLRADPGGSSAEPLDNLPDELKVEILQQFFRHVSTGSHKASFDQRTIAVLLQRWFGIELGAKSDNAIGDVKEPGRATNRVYCVKFGETMMFLYMSDLKAASARRLVEVVANEAVLTTETTSPPCELSEFVTLWLQNRTDDPGNYYLRGGSGAHPIQQYFDQQLSAVASALSVTLTHCSTEMAIVPNGDALRFHRDRCIRQYQAIAEGGGKLDTMQLAQDLTLIDWDMQPGTISGTAIDHADGDRYLFLLRPSEVVGMFFAEQPKLPGPMMMPYHCALPVFDHAAALTVGPAKGKRLSALTRALAPSEDIAALTRSATELQIDDVITAGATARIYRSGVRVETRSALPATALVPVGLVDGMAEGVSIIELSAEANGPLLRIVTGEESLESLRFLRIEKHGEGFSDLQRVLPEIDSAREVFLINRSLYGPQREVCFAVALDRTMEGMPWFQLLRLKAGDIVRVPGAITPLLRLTPTDHLLHRSAPLDSFYPTAGQQGRLANIVEIAFR